MGKSINPDLPVLRWIARRVKPSHETTYTRWGHYLDRQVEGGFVKVHYVGIWRDGVSLTEAGQAAIAPKPKKAAGVRLRAKENGNG